MKGYLDLTKGSKPFKRSLVTSLGSRTLGLRRTWRCKLSGEELLLVDQRVYNVYTCKYIQVPTLSPAIHSSLGPHQSARRSSPELASCRRQRLGTWTGCHASGTSCLRSTGLRNCHHFTLSDIQGWQAGRASSYPW